MEPYTLCVACYRDLEGTRAAQDHRPPLCLSGDRW